MSKPIRSSTITKFFSYLRDRLPRSRTKHATMLGPSIVVTSMIYMNVLGVKSYRRVLSEMKIKFGRDLEWDREPTASAFCQARRKVSQSSMLRVFRELTQSCDHASRRGSFTFGDKRVVCCDGTNVVLPSDKRLLSYFGSPSNQHGPASVPQAGLVLLWDAARAMPIDFRVTPCKPNERSGLLDMLPGLSAGDLVVADRGFPSRIVFFAIAARKADFLIRMPRHAFSEVDDFFAGTEADRVIELTPPKGGRDKPMRMRLIKETAPSGKVRVLATSLCDADKYRAEELNALYRKRWNIETGLRELKIWHGLERMHARTPEGIIQEITALMIFLLFMAELEAMTHETYAEEIELMRSKPPRPGLRPESPFYRLECLPIRFDRLLIGDIVVNVLNECIAGRKNVAVENFRSGLDYIWRCRARPRPNRSYPRIPKSPNAKQRKVRVLKAKNA
jgi:hypothetical protein